MATATTPKKTRTAPAKAATPGLADPKAASRVATLLKMGGDVTRVRILCLLADGEHNVGAICAAIGLGQPATSHHLALCRHSGIVETRRSGKENFYALTAKGRILAEIVGRVIKEDTGW